MPLVCLGLSHHTAPVEVRESHAFGPAKMTEALIALRDYEAIREAAILQTCGRLELYADIEDYDYGITQLKAFLKNFRHSSVQHDMSSYMYTLLGNQAVDHLFRVSTGLDSMLIGEAEILGQVKDAYVQAQKAGSVGRTLHALFREALSAGKDARAHTSISAEYVSVATAAIELAKQYLGDLSGASVLVIGAGKMGTTAAKRLKLEGARELVVANRSLERAQGVVDMLGMGRALELPGLIDALKEADIVVTSTGASRFILEPGNVAEAMLARPSRPLFIIDIAVPRDTDPDVARIPGVRVADIDDLKSLVEVHLEHRREAIPMVEEIIGEHADRYTRWYDARVAVPVVASLVQKAEHIREAEIDRLFARCPNLSLRERMLITGATLTIISRLLHTVISKIRSKAVENREEALRASQVIEDLFELRTRPHDVTTLRGEAETFEAKQTAGRA